MMKLHLTFTLLVYFLTIFKLSSQIIDQEFNPLFKGVIENNFVKASAQQNKIIVGGYVNFVGQKKVNGVFRLKNNGSLDETFKIDIEINGQVRDIHVDRSNKILISGYNLSEKGDIIRLNEDGSFDSSFEIDEALTDIETAIIRPQSDGKYILANYSIVYNNIERSFVRLNNDGSVDDSFLALGRFNGGFNFEIDSEDNIIAYGNFSEYNFEPANNLLKLNSDGTIDKNFDIGDGLSSFSNNSYIRTIALMPDNSIIISGSFDSYDGEARVDIAKIFSSGELDESFSISPNIEYSPSFLAVINSDQVIAGGRFFSGNESTYEVNRLNNDGSIDNSFIPISYICSENFSPDAALLDNARVAVFGGITHHEFPKIYGIGLSDSIGNVFSDTPPVTAIGIINVMKEDTAGGLIIGGKFSYVNELRTNNLIRIKEDGTVDERFLENLGTGFDRLVSSLHIQDDGQILVGGGFRKLNEEYVDALVRLSSTGKLDTSFNSNISIGSVNEGVTSIVPYNDGFLIGGLNINKYSDGQLFKNFLKIKNDGSINKGFSTGALFDGRKEVNAIKVQGDNKVLVGGDSEDGGFFYRLNEDGSIDNSFQYDLDLSSKQITAIEITETKEIVLGSEFSSIFPNDFKTIWSLNMDGSFSRGKELRITSSGSIDNIIPLNKDTLIFTGTFTSINNVERNGFAVADLNGNLMDYDINLGALANGATIKSIFSGNNSLFVGGKFNTILGEDQFSSLVKIENCSPNISEKIEACDSFVWEGETLNESGTYEKKYTNIFGCSITKILDLEILSIPEVEIDFKDKAILHLPKEDEETGTYKYQWFNCTSNEPIEGATSSIFETEEIGEYYLEISNGNCVEKSFCLSNEKVLASKKKLSFSIYPNPFKNKITIILSGSINNTTIEILDINGTRCLKNKVYSTYTEIFSGIEKLKPGVYTLLIKQNNMILDSRKIVKK